MFYSVASPDWKPGQPLAPVGALLFRTRAEAESFAPEALVVSVSVCFDSVGCAVSAHGFTSASLERWSSRAVGNILGGVTVFGSIPAALIGSTGNVGGALASESLLSTRSDLPPNDFHGWDSITMALLA